MVTIYLSPEAINEFRNILISTDFSKLEDPTQMDIREIETQLREQLVLKSVSEAGSEIVLSQQECNSAKIALNMHGIYVDNMTELESELPLYGSDIPDS